MMKLSPVCSALHGRSARHSLHAGDLCDHLPQQGQVQSLIGIRENRLGLRGIIAGRPCGDMSCRQVQKTEQL